MQACCTSVALILWKETIEPYFILVLHLMAELQRLQVLSLLATSRRKLSI